MNNRTPPYLLCRSADVQELDGERKKHDDATNLSSIPPSHLPISSLRISFWIVQLEKKKTPQALFPAFECATFCCKSRCQVEHCRATKIAVTEKIKSQKPPLWISALSFGSSTWLVDAHVADATEIVKLNLLYETGELFELGIQLSYLLLLLALLGVGSFYVIRQVLVCRELDLSAKELQEQVRSGDASATELFELGAVMLRRKFYPAATKYLLQAIDKWDGDNQDLAQVYNALGVSYVRDEKIDKGIAQFEAAVKIQPGYVTAWNNLGDALEKKEDITAALKAFEEVLMFDPNNKVARPRRDALTDKVAMYKGVPVKTKKKSTMPR